MKIIKLQKFAEVYRFADETPMTPILNGTVVDVFHRTNSQEVVGNICESGFIAGAGAMYGAGIYANYTLKSAMQGYGLGAYGGIVVRGSVNLRGFIIYDYAIAEKVYGNNYRLPDQIEKEIGWDKVLSTVSPAEIESAKKTLWGYHDFLKKRPRRSAGIAQQLQRRFPAAQSRCNGILFTGDNDGNTVVAYNGGLVVPKAHAFIDNRTKNEFDWKECLPSSREALESLVDAMQVSGWQKVNAEREKLVKHLSEAATDPSRASTIRKENYPLIPQVVFDSMLIGLLYKDRDLWKSLNRSVKEELRETAPSSILVRELESEPILNWQKYQEADQATKDKVGIERVRDIWQKYANENPLQWKKIPQEAKAMIDPSAVIQYFAGTVQTNAANLMYVPEDLREEVQKLVPVSDKKMQQVKEREEKSEIRMEESEEFVIPQSSMGWFENEIKKLNKKAERIGLPPIEVTVVKEDPKNYTKSIRITRNIPIFEGNWELVAKIMPTIDPDTKKVDNNIQKLGTKPLPEKYLDEYPQCEHCKTNRRRNEVYVLYSNETGDYMTVGSTCLNAFIGDYRLKPDQVAKYAELLQNSIAMFRNAAKGTYGKKPDKMRSGFKRQGVPLPYFLGRCVMVMHKEGSYISGGKAYKSGGVSTGKRAYEASLSEKIDNQYYQDLSSADIVWINNTIDWLYGMDTTELAQKKAQGDDYLYNLVTSIENGSVKKKGSNYAASALMAYKRYQRDQGLNQQQLMEAKGKPVFLNGVLKDKVPLFFQLQTGQTTPTDSNYCIAEDANGNLVVWGDNKGFQPNIDDPIHIKGKVSDYTVMDGKSATILDEVEIISIEEFNQNAADQNARTEAFRQSDARLPQKKKVYNAGDAVADTFEVADSKIARNGNVLYQVKDASGTRLSFFMPPPMRYGQGDKIYVTGTISVRGRYLNIEDPKIVDPTAPELPVYQKGDVFEDAVRIVDSYTYESAYGTNAVWVVEDKHGVAFEFSHNKSTANLNVGDIALIKGTVKDMYRGKWKLLRVKVVDMLQDMPQPPPAQVAEQEREVPEDQTQPQEQTDDASVEASGLNWFSRYKVAKTIYRIKKTKKE